MSILFSLIKDLVSRKSASSHARAANRLGDRMAEEDKLEAGIAHYQDILRNDPNHVEALYNLGLIFEMQGKEEDALASYRKTVSLNAAHYAARLRVLHLLQRRCEWNGWEGDIQELRAVVRHPGQLTQTNVLAPYSFLSLPGTTAQEQMWCAQRWAKVELWRPNIDALRAQIGLDAERPASDKIRIGYLSADFRQHVVATVIAEVLALHDRSRFQITAYSYGPDDGSAMRMRLQHSVDDFVDIRNESLEATAKRIHGDGIDILVDLTGYTVRSRSSLLALRPAPVQVNFLGYPGTLGADCVDHILADKFVIPAEMRQYYTENVAWLPDCFMPSDRTRPRPTAPARTECGLPEEGFVFCCMNQPFKITPMYFDVWCRLLNEVPKSVLWLSTRSPVAAGNLKREAARRGVDPDRLVMAPSNYSEERHLARLQCADLFLDTSPYNAHAACGEALWMGLPVLTCAGDTFPSRVAGSMLTTLGVPELVTHNLDDYYQRALELATSPEKHDAIRRKVMANRDTSALFDTPRFVRNLEDAYIGMTQKVDEKRRRGA